jgi:hypothetical protein
MVVDRDDVRRALRERVERQVHARGIPRHVIEAAVDQVVAALPSGAGSGHAPERGAEVVATFSAVSAPDLASRVRNALREDGVSVLGLGSATAGRHTVVTVLARGDEPALGRAAARASATLGIVSADAMERA